MLLERLRDETRARHTALESALGLPRPGYTRADHRALMARYFGFFQPWDLALAARLDGAGLASELSGRAHAPRLAADLEALGLDASARAALPRATDLPPLDGAGGLFGAMYVVEGSTLGGRFLARWLREVLGTEADVCSRFYSAYGDRTGAMWRQFRAVLTERVPEDQHDAAVAAADGTFARMHRWLCA